LDNFYQLIQVVAKLRDPDAGCPWDLEQTAQSLCRFILEEAYETVAAIESKDAAAIKDELGDLLFQVVLQSQIASESGQFSFDQVAQAVAEKLIRRHPHVFGGERISDAKQQSQRWEQLKQQERQRSGAQPAPNQASILDGLSGTLPAMTQAIKLQQRAASVGFDWKSITPIFDKVAEELEETRVEVVAQNADAVEDEIGDLFFAVTNLARHAGVDPETSLRRSNRKFMQRFKVLENRLREQGLDISVATQQELEQLWQQVKSDMAETAQDEERE